MAVALAVEPETTVATNGHAPASHHEDCPRQIYMERERLKFVWGVARWGDRFEYLKDKDFWRVWGPKHMPECICQPSTGTLVELRPTNTNGNGHSKNGAFRLHYQHRLTAPIYSGLRGRLVTWAYKQTGDVGVVDMELETLARMAGKGSKSVLATLMAFETKHRHSSSSDHGISPGHGKPSRSSSVSKIS